MNERQVDRLERRSFHEEVERRGPQQHAAASHPRSISAGRAVVEPRQRLRALGAAPRCDSCRNGPRKSRRCAARGTARRRMSVFETRRARAAAPRDRSTVPTGVAGSRSAALAGQVAREPATTSRPPPFSTNRFSRCRGRVGETGVVEDHDRERPSRSSAQVVACRGCRPRTAARRRWRARARDTARRRARARALRPAMHAHRSRRRQHEVEALSRASASSPMRTTPRVFGPAQRRTAGSRWTPSRSRCTLTLLRSARRGRRARA